MTTQIKQVLRNLFTTKWWIIPGSLIILLYVLSIPVGWKWLAIPVIILWGFETIRFYRKEVTSSYQGRIIPLEYLGFLLFLTFHNPWVQVGTFAWVAAWCLQAVNPTNQPAKTRIKNASLCLATFGAFGLVVLFIARKGSDETLIMIREIAMCLIIPAALVWLVVIALNGPSLLRKKNKRA